MPPRKPTLDLLIVTDDADIIKVYTEQVVRALESISPKLNVKRFSAPRIDYAETQIRGCEKILFLYDDRFGGIEKKPTMEWIQGFLSVLNDPRKYMVISKQNYKSQTDKNDGSIDKVDGIKDDKVGLDKNRFVSITDFSDVTKWWPRVLKFLFEIRKKDSIPNVTSSLLMANTRDDQSKTMRDQLQTMFRAFDCDMTNNTVADVNIVLLDKEFKPDEAVGDIETCLSTSEQATFGLHLVCSHALPIPSNLNQYSNSVHNKKTLLTAVLFILIDLGILHARRLTMFREVKRQISKSCSSFGASCHRDTASAGSACSRLCSSLGTCCHVCVQNCLRKKFASRCLAIGIGIINIPIYILYASLLLSPIALWACVCIFSCSDYSLSASKWFHGMFMPIFYTSAAGLVPGLYYVVRASDSSSSIALLIILPVGIFFIWGTVINAYIIFNRDIAVGVIGLPFILWDKDWDCVIEVIENGQLQLCVIYIHD